MEDTNRCPFTAMVLELTNSSVITSALICEDMRRLATIVKVAHTSDDVWMGIRTERALNGYKGGGLAPYINGRHFMPFLSKSGEIIYLETLRDHACRFLDKSTN